MSALSRFGKEVINKVYSKLYSKDEKGKVTYNMQIKDKRKDPTAFETKFTFRRPINNTDLEASLPEYMQMMSEQLTLGHLGVISAVLRKAGLNPGKMGKSTKTSGEVKVRGTGAVEEGLNETNTNSIRTKGGRFISIANFTSLINVLMKPYMVRNMVAPALVYKTGRFANSSNIDSVRVLNNPAGLPILDISFSYMEYPYETFDPDGPNTRGLASPDRNPRRIIGDAITQALDDVISERHYSVRISQS